MSLWSPSCGTKKGISKMRYCDDMELPEFLEQQRALTTLGQNRSVNLDNISLTLQSLQRLSTESIFRSCQSCCSHNRQVDELDKKELSEVSLHKVNSGDVKIIMSKPSWVQTVPPAPDFSDTYDEERFDWLETSLEEELPKDPPPSQSKEPQIVEKLKRFDSNNETPNFVDNKVFSDPSLYGSLPDQMDSIRNDAGQGPHRVIFCVHGKPSGCCATQIMVPDNVPPQTITIDTDEHCHIGTRNDGVDTKARKKIIFASVLCVIFMIAEMVGGFMSNSLAIATDAAHLLTDFASFMISLFSIWVAARKPTRVFLFGWHRAEVIGAVASVLTIWVVTGILVYLAIERIISKDYEIDTEIMLITSALGLLVNLIMGCALHQHTHHTHGHGHGETQNINVRAAFIHVVGDFIQSSGVFIAALLIYFNGPSWYIVDPICTFMFSILVMFTTFAILRDAMLVLMEGMPKGVEYAEVLDTLLSIDNVVRVHNLRIWALSLDKTALAAHIVINKNVSTDEILKIASRKIHAKYNFFEMTLQIEYFQEKMEDCKQCQEPEK